MSKPILKLIGQDKNAFVILGLAQRAAKKDGWTKEAIDKFLEEAKSGDHDHLLSTCSKYFNIQ